MPDPDDLVLRVLELLAQEAPSSRFEELLCTAPPAQQARLDRAVRLALEVRTSTEQRRRRETGLAALLGTSQDMAAQTSLDGLLSVITTHARRLLDFDMAYVSLRLPDGTSYVHRSDGETNALTTGLELDRGLGIGSLVQDKQAPFWAWDYLTDARFEHSPKIDEVVVSEGLHAILAVPIVHNGQSIGALYGASREIRHFSPDEVSLLRSLAVLSASAIETSKQTDQLRLSMTVTRSEFSRAAMSLQRMTFLADTQARLVDLVVEGGDAHDVTALAAQALDAVLVVRDAVGNVVARTGELPELDPNAVVKAVVDAQAQGRPVAVVDGVWATRVSTGVEGPGVLLCHSAAPLTEEGLRLLRDVGQTVALVQLLRDSVAAAAGPARDECLDDLLSGAPQSSRRLVERVRRLGIDPARPHVVLVLRTEGGKQGEAAVWANSYAYRRSGLKTVRGECLVLLLPASDASSAAREAAAELTPLLGHPVTVGAAGPAADLMTVGKLFQEAKRCLDTLVALGRAGSTAAAEDLGFLGLLLSDDHDVDAFITSAIGPVLAYDAERSTDLVQVLDAYFASGGSPTRAAQDLHVHANTVARRLDRIAELLGPDWSGPAKALEIQLALRLHRTRDVVYEQRQADQGS
jgi:GAF domain-containing protein